MELGDARNRRRPVAPVVDVLTADAEPVPAAGRRVPRDPSARRDRRGRLRREVRLDEIGLRPAGIVGALQVAVGPESLLRGWLAARPQGEEELPGLARLPHGRRGGNRRVAGQPLGHLGPDMQLGLRAIGRAAIARLGATSSWHSASARTLTDPLPWHAKGSENVRVSRLSPTLPSLSSPGPVAPRDRRRACRAGRARAPSPAAPAGRRRSRAAAPAGQSVPGRARRRKPRPASAASAASSARACLIGGGGVRVGSTTSRPRGSSFHGSLASIAALSGCDDTPTASRVRIVCRSVSTRSSCLEYSLW